jgi:hypothetical protein
VVQRSEELVFFISAILWEKFPEVMRYLKEMRRVEEIQSSFGSFGGTPFTTMATSKDYNVNIHKDMDDYGWSFILWMGFESTSYF